MFRWRRWSFSGHEERMSNARRRTRSRVWTRLMLRRAYEKLTSYLPRTLVDQLERLSPIHPFEMSYRRALARAVRSGPPYRPTHREIVIDITSRCNLHCIDCNRSCGTNQASDDSCMTIDQIRKFIRESIEQRRRWSRIQLEGGEPTTHPDVIEIVRLIRAYIDEHSRGTALVVLTNGYGPDVNDILLELTAAGADVENDGKRSRKQERHCAFNVAPCDMQEMAGIDFSRGCHLPALHGLGLTRHGYYSHPVCGGIDRVFGLGVGRTRLPEPHDGLDGQFATLCRYCGMFRFTYRLRGGGVAVSESALAGTMSQSWRDAYARFGEDPPQLEQY